MVHIAGTAYTEFYNSLPDVSEAAKAAETESKVRAGLAAIISAHRLENIFAVRLLHKHFSMKPGERVVFQTFNVPNFGRAITMGPLTVSDDSVLFGQNFALFNGELAAYEYTMNVPAGRDPGQYPEFAKEVVDYLLQCGPAASIFGLMTFSPSETNSVIEFEFVERRTTITVPSEFFPVDKDDETINTVWYLDESLPPPYYDCMQTRSQIHYGCKRTKSQRHYGVRKIVEATKAKTEMIFDEESSFTHALKDPSSPFFKIVDYVISVM